MRPTNFATVGLIGIMGCVESAPNPTPERLVLEPENLSVTIVDGKPVAQAYRATLVDSDGARDVTAETTFVLANEAFGDWSASTLQVGGEAVGPTRIRAAHGELQAETTLTVYARTNRLVDAPTNAAASFDAATAGDCAPTISYPASQVVMPLNLGELDVQWADSRDDLFEIALATTYVDTRIYTRAAAWAKLGTADWNRLAGQHEAIALRVSGMIEQSPDVRCTAAAQQIFVTDQNLTGDVYLTNADGMERADAAYPTLARESLISAAMWDAKLAPISGGPAAGCAGCSLSRDGARMAITSETTGAIYDFATGALTAPDAQSWSSAAFTANGEKLITARGGDLHIITRTGAQLSSIIHKSGYQALDPQVSPDGRWLVNVEAMSTEDPTEQPGSGAPALVSAEQTLVLPTIGSTIVVRQFFDGSNEMGSSTELMPLVPGMAAYYPAWSPDGRYIVFTLATGLDTGTPIASLWIVRADGTEKPIQLTSPSNLFETRARFVPQALSVGGESIYMIAFESNAAFGEQTGRHVQLWAMPFYPDRTVDSAGLCNAITIAPCTATLRAPAPAIRLPLQSLALDNRLMGWL